MFITKKNYQKALEEQKMKLESEFDRKLAENNENMWRMQSEERYREDACRRFEGIESRLETLERAAGLREDRAECPLGVKPARY